MDEDECCNDGVGCGNDGGICILKRSRGSVEVVVGGGCGIYGGGPDGTIVSVLLAVLLSAALDEARGAKRASPDSAASALSGDSSSPKKDLKTELCCQDWMKNSCCWGSLIARINRLPSSFWR